MDKGITLILGGARSGKSRFAQKIAGERGTRVLFVATAEPLDTDMSARIENHKRERPPSWRTVEAAADVAAAIRLEIGDAEVVLVDCLTLLVSNILLGEDRMSGGEGGDPSAHLEAKAIAEATSLADLANESTAAFVIVSNEVGLGLVPENRLGRLYRDVLGRVNQIVAETADEVYFMVSGIPLKVKG